MHTKTSPPLHHRILRGMTVCLAILAVPHLTAGAAGNQPPPRAPLAEVVLYAVADTWVDGDYGNNRTNTNFGDKQFMHVYGGSAPGAIRNSAISDLLLRFDLSPLPAGALISNATLRLFWLNDGGGSRTNSDSTFYVHGALKPWMEGNSSAKSGVTFTTSDGATLWDGGHINASAANYDTSATSSRFRPGTVSWMNTYQSFTATTLAQAWYAGTRPNHGLVVTCKGWAEYNIEAREAGTHQPELVIQYKPPEPPPPPGITLHVR